MRLPRQNSHNGVATCGLRLGVLWLGVGKPQHAANPSRQLSCDPYARIEREVRPLGRGGLLGKPIADGFAKAFFSVLVTERVVDGHHGESPQLIGPA